MAICIIIYDIMKILLNIIQNNNQVNRMKMFVACFERPKCLHDFFLIFQRRLMGIKQKKN